MDDIFDTTDFKGFMRKYSTQIEVNKSNHVNENYS